ncbi:MAG: DUF169 domain-containing protein [Bacteroidales bacterium]|nr:DUF169 domain-containing protein [Bacteroidales bacterium]
MKDFKSLSQEIKEKLGMNVSPVGVLLTDSMPEDALHFKKKGSGCVANMIYNSAKGKTFAFDENATGLPCSAFYLGYTEWIFDGIEGFLSNECTWGREPERFIKTPAIAKEFVKSYIPKQTRKGAIVFKTLELFTENEKPELVIFFVNADQISALQYLVGYGAPREERIISRFASACMSVFTVPMEYAERGEKKAVWGFHDISVRSKMPKDITSMTFTWPLFEEICGNLNESFLTTEHWIKLRERN